MLVFLRCLGITNAAVWFGSAIFFTVAVSPAFNAAEMLERLPPWAASYASHILLDRYFVLQCWCGGIALAHLISEGLYTGQTLRRWSIYVAVGMFVWSLLGAGWLQPKLKRLHLEIHGIRSTQEQRVRAGRSYRLTHGFFQAVNVVAVFGLFAHLMQVTASGTPPRFMSSNKFRG